MNFEISRPTFVVLRQFPPRWSENAVGRLGGLGAMHSIFYILLFSFTTVFGFATNLHLLSFLGIDTAKVLDVRAEEYRQLPHGRVGNAQFVHPSRLYPPLYALAVIGWLWTAFGWSVFHRLAGSDAARMVEWRAVPAIVALVALAAIFAPMNGLYRKERMMFLRSVSVSQRSTLTSTPWSPN